MPKSSSKVWFDLEFFNRNLYFCVKYSNIVNDVEILKLIIKSDAQRKWPNLVWT